LRNYVNLIIHEALKLQPVETVKHSSASSRITSLFIELLERQFPVDSMAHSLKLRTAIDYATQLSVHPNHLNRAVKETTGKTVTEHISERIIKEAKALLKHTDWSVAEIAYCLGFENPPYFNNFFKKQTALTPNTYRK
jgi:AraC-like DNA-binding protein